MGYYTSYKLTIQKGNSDLISDLIEQNEDAAYCLDPYGDPGQMGTWYEHEEDMKKFSSQHPFTLFKLEGDGETNPDTWIKYFLNGKMQVCKGKITFDEFDESKLI